MFETGFLRVVAWLTLIASLVWGVPLLGAAISRGDPSGVLVPLAIVGGGLSYWAVVITFAGIADNVRRMTDRVAPRAEGDSSSDAADDGEDVMMVGGYRVKKAPDA